MTPYIDPREQLVVEVFVRDLARSVAFYQALAFELLDEKAGFATLGWEGCRIFLDERPDAPRPGHPQANVRVMVADIHAAWQRAQALGAPILTELADRGYGLLDFTVLDPDGFGVRSAPPSRGTPPAPARSSMIASDWGASHMSAATNRATTDVGGHRLDTGAAHAQHAEATQHTSSVKGRWATTAVGVGIAGYGLSQKSASGVGLALVGAGIAYLGATGRLPLGAGAPGGDGSVRVEQMVTINRPPSEVFAFWRDLANLPRFMTHLQSVTPLAGGRSHWVANAPFGKTVEWDAEIINEEPGRFIAWRSVEGADIENTGAVRFEDAPGGRGTEARVKLEYAPPAGVVGAAVAKLFGEEPSLQIHDDLRRLKSVLEAGEIPTTEGQPRGGSSASKLDPLAQKARQVLSPVQDALSGEQSPSR